MITMPKTQFNHRYIDSKIKPWLDLHFPADSSFNGRIFLAYRRKDGNGIYDLTRRNIGELSSFVEEMHVSRNMDYYITANSVCGVRRVTEEVFGLHNIVIDIDCHAGTHSPALLADFVWRCSRDLWSTGDCPEPNSIVFSGRGVQLWWALEPASVKIQYWYKRMQSWLMDALQGVLDESPEQLGELSIDRSASKKLAGLFRLPFTFNSKTGRKGSLQIRRKTRYSLRKMLEEYVPAEYNPNHKKPSERFRGGFEVESELPKQEYVPLAGSDAEVLKGGKTAMARRVQQLVRLRALRNAPMGEEMRDRFCFTVYCALLADHEQEEAWRRLVVFNEGFKQPLPYPALKQMMSSATEKKYRLTNKWVIAELVISEDEQEAIGLRVAEARSERMSRNYTRDLIRKSLREDRDNKILALFSEGKSKSEISRELGLSWNTVAKVIAAEEKRSAVMEETEAIEQVAAGAEYQNVPITTSLKMVRNNIVSYGEGSTKVSFSGGRAVRSRGEPPPE